MYGGRGLGFTFDAFAATVKVESAAVWSFAFPLLEAGWSVLRDELDALGVAAPGAFAVTATSTLPRQVGLAGSSALLIAELRALAACCGATLSDARVAELALRAECEVLGIRAGPLDRLVQAHGGVMAMDFAEPFVTSSTVRLEASLLPPMFVAWVQQTGDDSGAVHNDVWQRWHAGDEPVRAVMQDLARGADDGLDALHLGDHARFCDAIDRNFDLRASIFTIRDIDRRLVMLGRDHGAATKFCGSGGAALVVPRGDTLLSEVADRYRDAGFGVTDVRVAETVPVDVTR